MNYTPRAADALPDPERDLDLLMARIVDGEAAAADWKRFQGEAQREPALWRELAEWQRQHAVMTAAMGSAIEVAEAIEAPAREGLSIRFNERLRVVGMWSGWAVAATLALAALSARIQPESSTQRDGNTRVAIGTEMGQDASFVPLAAGNKPSTKTAQIPAADLFRAYVAQGLEQGTVLGEMPRRIVAEPRLLPDGQVELLYARQILERQVVPNWYRVGTDELGRPLPIQPEIVRTSGRAY